MLLSCRTRPLDAHVATPQDLKERIAAERRGTPFLVYRDADDLQVIVDLVPAGERLTIGRRPSNDIVLDWDSEISRVHAALERIGEDWTVVDDGLSHNGTYLNGSRVTSRQRLRDGDVLTVGGVTLAFRAPGGESVSRPTVTALGPHVGELLTPAQRRVLVALCRPFKDSTYATPATNQQIADELVVSRRRGQEHAARAVRGLRRRRAAAEPEARVAGAAGPAHRRDHPPGPVSTSLSLLSGRLATHTASPVDARARTG